MAEIYPVEIEITPEEVAQCKTWVYTHYDFYQTYYLPALVRYWLESHQFRNDRHLHAYVATRLVGVTFRLHREGKIGGRISNKHFLVIDNPLAQQEAAAKWNKTHKPRGTWSRW